MHNGSGQTCFYYKRPRGKIPTYSQFMEELSDQRKGSADKPNYMNAIDEIRDAILEYMEEHGLWKIKR
jgi:hypothetical protein